MNKINLKKYGSNKKCLKRKRYVYLILFIIFFLTVGYSSLGTVLSLRGQVFVRTDKNSPTVTYSVLSGNYNTDQTIEITPIDNESGVDYYSIYVYKDEVLLDSYENLETEKHEVLLSETGTYEIRTFVVDKFGNVINMEPLIDDMYYQTYSIDKEAPSLVIDSVQNGTSATVTLTVSDIGSGLSSSNIYKYCLSTSSIVVTDCVWIDYNNGTSFSINGLGTRYLLVYPVKDNANNVNNSKTFGTPYCIMTYDFYYAMPKYTYLKSDGTPAKSELIDDGEGNWRIKFLESGTFIPETNLTVDVFLVGGGGGGGGEKGGGGGGGYTLTNTNIDVSTNETYSLVVGAGGNGGVNSGNGSRGGTTSAFGYSAGGGYGGTTNGYGGNGGSGGGESYEWQGGGSDGGKGAGTYGGKGQGTTTREFAESTGTLYAGGGGGSGGDRYPGGAGGGGAGGTSSSRSGIAGTANTGGGGGGANNSDHSDESGGKGGSGIIIIRNAKTYRIGDFVYTYSGSQEAIDDGNGNWRIKFKTSGNLTFKELPNNAKIDLFLVGGGGGGGGENGGGGGGGYTSTNINVEVSTNTTYSLVIGSGGAGGVNSGNGSRGQTTSAFGYSVEGGYGGTTNGYGGNGGSGGGESYEWQGGGSDGGKGAGTYGGKGQGTTTREFAESTGTLYAGGGGGSGGDSYPGGAGGGGAGGTSSSRSGIAGTANTGGGGGGANNSDHSDESGGKGGSGIIVIRNARTYTVGDFVYTYSGSQEVIDDGDGNWRIKFKTSGDLTFKQLPSNAKIDLFLVGGGGGGGGENGGGGGGGYTSTNINVEVSTNTIYSLVVGSGGAGGVNSGNGSRGQTTSAFGYSVEGGYGGTTNGYGGNGGSGGGESYEWQGGGSDGGNGAGTNGGKGQGTTTREFAESTGTLYAGGGGGSGGDSYPGGAGGGGAGANASNRTGIDGTANTGGGGGGANNSDHSDEAGGKGGSGIIIIRNAR